MLRTLLFASLASAAHIPDVKADIKDVMIDAAADDGSYAGLFIRLTWHCTGSYRTSDGRGGCDGGRIRFAPEKDWSSNIGLDDVALPLLQEIKTKYGDTLSWGDLIVLAGTVAIEEGGVADVAFCGGRVDDADGAASMALNNTEIYLPGDSTDAEWVRSSFAIMDMTDRETVALIGGGHAFGRAHDFRSGFDGPWTSNPTQFSNEFFTNLLNMDWVPTNSSGKWQNEANGLMMLNTDLALKQDAAFLAISEEYAADAALLKTEFKAAWEKLMTRDLGHKPCAGSEPTETLSTLDTAAVKAAVVAILDEPSYVDGNLGPLFVRLTWHCTGTFRATDYRGGCNGGRIRFAPESDWGANAGLDMALDYLTPIKTEFGAALSWADLIVIAGSAAFESMGALPVDVCIGRTDDVDGAGSAYLEDDIYVDGEHVTLESMLESMGIMGFDAKEMTVLNGGGHSVGRTHPTRSGFDGPWTADETSFSNSFFTTLKAKNWTIMPVNGTTRTQYESDDGLAMLHSDMLFLDEVTFRPHVDAYAADNALFLSDFQAAWDKLINADRYGMACTRATPTAAPTTAPTAASDQPTAAGTSNAFVAVPAFAVLCSVVLSLLA